MEPSHFDTVPRHLALTMDGNRRYATAHGQPRLWGHRQGRRKLKEVIRWCLDLGIEYLTVYALSTENLRQRPPQELRGLNRLLGVVLREDVRVLVRHGVRIRVLGDRTVLGQRLRALIDRAERRTADNRRLQLQVCYNYGGQQDLVNAVRRIVATGMPVEQVDESVVAHHLSTAGLPLPDVLIRTGGYSRLSNFLLWELAYATLVFTPTLWPDLTRDEFVRLLGEAGRQEHNLGR